MSMFDNVIFDEYSLLEGQQAEEYKKRKAKEKEEAEKKNFDDKMRSNYRNNTGSKPIYRNTDDAKADNRDPELSKKFHNKFKDIDDIDELEDKMDKITGQVNDGKVRKEMRKRIDSGKSVSSDDFNKAYDASRRHARRQAKHESVMTMIEAYEPGYNY